MVSIDNKEELQRFLEGVMNSIKTLFIILERAEIVAPGTAEDWFQSIDKYIKEGQFDEEHMIKPPET